MHTKPLCSFIFGREINMVCRSHRKYSVCCQILSGALRVVWYLVNTVTIEILVFGFCVGVVHTYQITIFLFFLPLVPHPSLSLPSLSYIFPFSSLPPSLLLSFRRRGRSGKFNVAKNHHELKRRSTPLPLPSFENDTVPCEGSYSSVL